MLKEEGWILSLFGTGRQQALMQFEAGSSEYSL
jgi:hypothetical protein